MALKYNGHVFQDSARCTCCTRDKKMLVIDPTGTAKLRTTFRSDFNKRWGVVRQAIRQMIDKQDILGLKGSSMLQIAAPGVTLSGTRQEMFARWIDITLRQAVYGNDGTWIARYLETAFQAGTKFAQGQIKEGVVNRKSQHRFDGITALARAEMQGIMSAVTQQSIRVVALGIATGEKPMTIVRGLWAIIDRTGMNRTNAMLNLMVVKAFGDATLDVYEAAGVTEVGLIPESAGMIRDAQTQQTTTQTTQDARKRPSTKRRAGPGSRSSRKQTPSASTIGRIRRAEQNVERALKERVNVRTAGDDDVCPICERISEDGPYSINRARQLIPAHPHCRCVFVPANDRRFATDTRVRGELVDA